MSLIVSCLPHVVCIEPMMMKKHFCPSLNFFFFWNTIMILLFLKQTKISSFDIMESKNPCNVYWAGCHRQFYNVEISNALFNYYDFMLQKGSLFCFNFLEFLSSFIMPWFMILSLRKISRILLTIQKKKNTRVSMVKHTVFLYRNDDYYYWWSLKTAFDYLYLSSTVINFNSVAAVFCIMSSVCETNYLSCS